jgi:predicted membrane protein
MNDTSILLWGVVFGSIGLGFFIYGRKQQAVVPLVVGIALFVVPYVIANLYLLLLAGIILVALPYFVRL